MDVDEGGAAQQRGEGEKVLVKDQGYAITERKGLPEEVVRAVVNSGPFPFSPPHMQGLLLTEGSSKRSVHSAGQGCA